MSIVMTSYKIYIQVPSHVLMGVPHSASSLPLSALGDACVRRDLTAIHEILDTLGYKDDEGVANEVCTVAHDSCEGSSIFSFFSHHS